MIRRWTKDTRGIAAVEFALIAPVMVATLLGMIEANNIITSYSKSVSAAQTVSDLVSQSNTLTTTQVDSIVVGAQRVLDPLVSSITTLSVDVSSIAYDASGNPYQAWTYHWGKTSTPPAPTLAKGLGAANESVIVAALSYICTPLIAEIVPKATFNQVAITRPRTTRKIAYNGVTG
jgi:Flp pilus assembly protein TadG